MFWQYLRIVDSTPLFLLDLYSLFLCYVFKVKLFRKIVGFQIVLCSKILCRTTTNADCYAKKIVSSVFSFLLTTHRLGLTFRMFCVNCEFFYFSYYSLAANGYRRRIHVQPLTSVKCFEFHLQIDITAHLFNNRKSLLLSCICGLFWNTISFLSGV